jgi:hypothetical protein
MRVAPTSRYLLITAAVVGAVLVGCASSAEAEFPDPAVEQEDTRPTKKEERPEFEPTFDPEGDGDSNPSGDPTPRDGDQCIDNSDPGGAENLAKALPPTDDCDDDYKTVSGVAKGQVDVDFYKLSAEDRTLCNTETDFEGLTAGTEICVYARCKNSTVNAVSGCLAGTPSTSDIGMKGCCAAAPGRATPDLDCSGWTDDDSSDFFIRVKQLNADKCLPYQFAYRF